MAADWRAGSGSILLWLSWLLLVGCNQEDKLNSDREQARGGRPAGKLQDELDALRNIPYEQDSAKRPLVLSRPASDRKTWAIQVLEDGYAQSGHARVNWDAAVHTAFQEYVEYSRVGAFGRYSNLTHVISTAMSTGCDDPMIRYMQVRYNVADQGVAAEDLGVEHVRAFQNLSRSQYHPALKFIAGYRAALAARSAQTNCNRSVLLAVVTADLYTLACDTNAPAPEVLEPAAWWVEYAHSKSWLPRMFSEIQPILEQNWKQEPAYYEVCGAAEIGMAWVDRGGGFANTVKDKGWEGFRRHLDQAEPLLNTAWKMNPTNAETAYRMMQLELGQGRGRERMQEWFSRAMALATNYYDAANLMSFYLEPRWYGSEATALEFARSCVASTNWGGTVPLVLRSLHYSLARYYNQTESPSYWHRPQVWADVKAAFEKFYQLNPEDVGYRHDYAHDAFLCGQYAEFLSQTKLFTTGTNYSYFGGEAQFKSMLALAASKAK
ncbi:MAG TPA: hypothetical protein VFE51_18675 [Verrucomicrobiae bacterium]|nr:hypothetical protein [Verrucomicrobiae bacterium]